MARTKKSFDKDLMYKKIMPTNMKKDPEHSNQGLTDELSNKVQEKEITVENINTIFKNKLLYVNKDDNKEIILFNITEKLVLNKLDATIKKMNCCRCDRCKEDIIALALNNLKPMYVVSSKEEIDRKIEESNKNGQDIITAIIKAVLVVRKNPRH